MKPVDHHVLFDSKFTKLARLADSDLDGPYAVWYKPSHCFDTVRMSMELARSWLQHFSSIEMSNQGAAIAKAEAWAQKLSESQTS